MAVNKCPVCNVDVGEKDDRTTANELIYHSACFKCDVCKRSVVNDFYTEETRTVEIDMPDMFVPMQVEQVQLFCLGCTKKNKGKSCDGCKKPFRVVNTIFRANRQSWHPQCLVCAGCGSVVNKEFFVRDEKIYCPKTTCGGIHLISSSNGGNSTASKSQLTKSK